MRKTLFAGASLTLLMLAGPALAGANDSTGWLAAIGDTSAIQTASRNGAGVTIGLVDTGVVASNPELRGRVSPLSSCAAVSFVCSSGFTDDEGHGTATAAIAAGAFNTGDLMSGVAPAATILAEKVLNASGTGSDQDVANGIIRAANGGAQVINLSLTYIPTATVVNAINYATQRGVVLVWAGGNSSLPLNGGANTLGLSTTSLSHIIFAGSLSPTGALSSFSNTPGTGYAVAGTARASYASLWLMAPGENIVAPGIQYGANQYAYWSGTSMAAPMVAGSVALLEATWPVLARNGTVAAVLLDTATDLGTKGVDPTYGQGELNLTRAFQPIGQLTVLEASGKAIPVSQLTGAVISGGALGQLSAIKASLANYTTFDSFQRNFTINLSGLITSASAAAFSSTVASLVSLPVTSGQTRFADGSSLTVAASDFAFEGQGLAFDSARSLVDRTVGPADRGQFYLALTDARGGLAAVGRGLGSSASFSGALWGPASAAAYQAQGLGLSNALMNLAQGGYFGAFGARVGAHARLAVSFSQSLAPDDLKIAPGDLRTSSSAMQAGMSLALTPHWSTGLTVSSLSERNAVLGAAYVQGGPLSLGDSHQSAAVGVSSSLALGGGGSLLVDATLAKTNARMGGGLVGQVSSLTSRGYGVSLLQEGAFAPGDRLTFTLRKPLRVVAGWAELAQTTVDQQGYAFTQIGRYSLRPDGDETDVSLGYVARVAGKLDLGAGLDYRADAENVKGLADAVARLSANWRF